MYSALTYILANIYTQKIIKSKIKSLIQAIWTEDRSNTNALPTSKNLLGVIIHLPTTTSVLQMLLYIFTKVTQKSLNYTTTI